MKEVCEQCGEHCRTLQECADNQKSWAEPAPPVPVRDAERTRPTTHQGGPLQYTPGED